MNMDVYQEMAVRSTGQNILVSASAGAGKTRVLVERLIKRCLEDRVGMDEVLAVTFTAAAAVEMKNRAAKTLQERLQTVNDPQQAEWIRKQMILLDSADITTIDAFCLTIIQKYFSVIGLDPATASNVMDEASVNKYKKAAFFKALQIYDEEHHDMIISLTEMFSPRSEDYETLQGMVDTIIKHADNSFDPEQWISNARLYAAPVKRLSQLPDEIQTYFYAAYQLMLDTILFHYEDMLKYAPDSDKVMKKYDDLTNAGNQLRNCRQYLESRNYDMFRESFCTFGEMYAATPADTKNIPYKNARDAFYKACDKLSAQLFDSSILISDHNECSSVINALCDIASLTRTLFTEAKRQDACMDFGDMERYALEILNANDQAVSKLYRSRLKEVMVDEFQDTSVLQNEIIKLLAVPGTIFRVGDVKQSIYRFRQAKPSLMRSLMDDPDTLQITLEHNYRSMDTIVNYCNRLFQRLMNTEGCQDSYLERDTVTVGTERQKATDGVPVRFVLINDQEDAAEEESPQKKELKAMWIAGEMKRMVEEEGRNWKDFAVLVRSHHDKPVLRNVFDRFGIPYDIDAREGFYNSILCSTIRSMLEWMLDRTNMTAGLAVLTSSFCGLDDADLAHLKTGYRSVLTGVRNVYPEIMEEMDELWNVSCTYGITALLTQIALRHHFYDTLPAKEKANFDYLFETAVILEENQGTVYDLLERMQAGTDEKSSDAVSRGKDEQVVTVTTIHQSKGLQYDTVFLWSTEQAKFSDASSMLMADDDLYLSIDHYDMPWRVKRPAAARIASAHKNNLEDIEEYSRLLYVALTRAEKRLIIVDAVKKEQEYRDEITLPVLAARKGMSGLILSAMKDVPGLFRIEHLEAENVSQPLQRSSEFVSELPHFKGETDYFAPVMTPSQTEFTSLPDLEMSRRKNSIAFGTRVHEIISALPDRPWTAEDIDPTGLTQEDIMHILAFSDSQLYRKALTMDIYKEYPFYIENKEIRMHGVIDFYAVNETEVLLVDFKTDHTDMNTLVSRYSAQLSAYRRALQQIYPGHTVKAFIWSLQNDTSAEIPVI
ncbi:MAG: UvrD-helicase domain-containing protein [Solobacterium sp.]|nr:UvrD-helicase domain-containing protein [Solobacterium sp.]